MLVCRTVFLAHKLTKNVFMCPFVLIKSATNDCDSSTATASLQDGHCRSCNIFRAGWPAWSGDQLTCYFRPRVCISWRKKKLNGNDVLSSQSQGKHKITLFSVTHTHTWYRYMPQKWEGQISRSANRKKQNKNKGDRLADRQTPKIKTSMWQWSKYQRKVR